MDINILTVKITWLLSILTVTGQLISLLLIILLFVKKWRKNIYAMIKKYGFIILLLSSLGATLGSLYFSEIADMPPCRLCWFQRIFMYPQAIILIIAFIKKETNTIIKYIFALSVIGILFSAYQYYGQISAILNPPAATVVCDVSGTSCVSSPFLFFGYITIPMMALTGFLVNIIVSALLMRANRK